MRYFILSLSLIVSLGGCKKKELQPPIVPDPVFTQDLSFTGSIDGSTFTASSLNGGCTSYGTRRAMSFQGWMESTDQTIYFTINNFKKVPGTFDLSISDTNIANSATGYYEKDHRKTYPAIRGQVKIINVLPGRIQGTFSFISNENNTVSGSFSFMPYYCD